MLDITSARETDQPIVVTVDTSSETLFVSAFTGYLIAIPYGKPDSSIKMTTKNRDSKALRFMPIPIR
jgi:Ni,Fe-hydrogenase I cytochrome b subunit